MLSLKLHLCCCACSGFELSTNTVSFIIHNLLYHPHLGHLPSSNLEQAICFTKWEHKPRRTSSGSHAAWWTWWAQASKARPEVRVRGRAQMAHYRLEKPAHSAGQLGVELLNSCWLRSPRCCYLIVQAADTPVGPAAIFSRGEEVIKIVMTVLSSSASTVLVGQRKYLKLNLWILFKIKSLYCIAQLYGSSMLYFINF